MTDSRANKILPFLSFLSQNDIKDIVFLLAHRPTCQLLTEIRNSSQLLAAVHTWYGREAAPSAIYQAMKVANMPVLASCILNTLPEVNSMPEKVSALRKLLFNIAVQFQDVDVPRLCEVLQQKDHTSDALDLMMNLIERSVVTDTNIGPLVCLGDMSPIVSILIQEFCQRFAAISASVPPVAAPVAAAAAAKIDPIPTAQIDTYPMKDPVCVIINVHRIPNRPDRIGSEMDVCRLESLFTSFRYHIFKKIDPKRDELQDWLKILKPMFSSATNFSCLVVFVMSHGINDYIEFADGNTLHYWNDIVRPFLDGCMRGRPKIFFFQCCRGELLQGAAGPPALLCDGPVALEGPVSHQDNLDLYVCHSTFQGFAAIREEARGSWFIQTMCDVLERPVRMDLECLRMTVTRELKNMQANVENNIVNQTPVVEKNTLTSHVYLRPENAP